MPPEIEADADAEVALYDDAAAPVAANSTGPAPTPVMAAAEVPPGLAAEPDLPEMVQVAPEPAVPDHVDADIAAPDVAAPVARTLDETVLAVLREEAEREAEARRAENVARKPVMETQTEMGLQVASSAVAGVAARRVARLKGVDPDAPPPRQQTRRDLLPEIDEINSSLRATSEKRSGESGAVAATMPPPVDPGRRSFRNGFVLAMVVVVIGVVAYVMAPKIVERMPGAGPAMTSYVAAVDSARLRLDASLRALIAALKSMTGDAG